MKLCRRGVSHPVGSLEIRDLLLLLILARSPLATVLLELL